MLLHRRISLALAALRVARYDGCASDICRAERRLNALLDELRFVPVPSANTRVEGALSVGLSLVDASGALSEVLSVGEGFVPVTVEVAAKKIALSLRFI